MQVNPLCRGVKIAGRVQIKGFADVHTYCKKTLASGFVLASLKMMMRYGILTMTNQSFVVGDETWYLGLPTNIRIKSDIRIGALPASPFCHLWSTFEESKKIEFLATKNKKSVI